MATNVVAKNLQSAGHVRPEPRLHIQHERAQEHRSIAARPVEDGTGVSAEARSARPHCRTRWVSPSRTMTTRRTGPPPGTPGPGVRNGRGSSWLPMLSRPMSQPSPDSHGEHGGTDGRRNGAQGSNTARAPHSGRQLSLSLFFGPTVTNRVAQGEARRTLFDFPGWTRTHARQSQGAIELSSPRFFPLRPCIAQPMSARTPGRLRRPVAMAVANGVKPGGTR